MKPGVARFELLILRPLSLACLIWAVVSLFQAEWFVAVTLLVTCFLVGVIGQSLHKGQTFRDLTRGIPPPSEVSESTGGLSHSESYRLAKVVRRTSWILAIVAMSLMIHSGLRFYFAVPIGLGVFMASGAVFLVVASYSRNAGKMKSRPTQQAGEQTGSIKALLHSVGEQRKEAANLKTHLANLTWNSDVSERLLLKARRRYPHKTELEIYSYVIEQYEKGQERKRLEAKEQCLAREPYEKGYMDSPKGSSSEASKSESAAPEEPTAAERKSSMLAGLNQDEMILLTMIKNRLDNPAQLLALQSMAKDEGVNYDKLLQLARAMNDAVPPLPYDRGRTISRTKDRY